ncbi:hypothetical protein RJ641_008397 [Dillenia turbinata]|uniref:ARM repeat superfamily protein n=1 Tax=Dillenia turbinata TaxID=194707 RepID=A0AAN8V1A5_9MAGN
MGFLVKEEKMRNPRRGMSEGEKAWEECGCILWDLAANKDHAEFMVQNLVLEVLLKPYVFVQEISLGILGNLACHEVPRKLIASTNGLIGIIVDQLFIDDTPCPSEPCRLPVGILLVFDTILLVQYIFKSMSAALFLAILDNQQEVMSILLPTLMKLGLPKLLISLLESEISKLKCLLKLKLFSLLMVIQKVCSNKELLHLIHDLIELSDDDELLWWEEISCVTAAVRTANIMTDAPEVASEITSKVWTLEPYWKDSPSSSRKLSPSSLCQYVLVLVSKSDIPEEDLLDRQVVDTNKEHESLTSTVQGMNARTMAKSWWASMTSRYHIASLSGNAERSTILCT